MSPLYLFLLLWCKAATHGDPIAPLEDRDLVQYCYFPQGLRGPGGQRSP